MQVRSLAQAPADSKNATNVSKDAAAADDDVEEKVEEILFNQQSCLCRDNSLN